MNALRWKRGLSHFFPKASALSRKVILLYHSVGHGPWALAPEEFNKQMQWLKTHCDVLTLDGLLQSKSQEKIQVAITFDDGYACLYHDAARILAAYQFPALVYLNTGWIESAPSKHKKSDENLGHYPGEEFLNWDEVVALKQQGWHFGSHGLDHLDLTLQSSDIVESELLRSKQMLEKYLNIPCHHFAYTWGKHNALVRNLVKANGYEYAVAAHHSPLNVQDDSFILPRMNIAQEYALTDFQNIVLGKWDYLLWIQRLKKMLRYRYEIRN